MKMIYVANSRIPTEKAHGVQIMNMCSLFSRLTDDFELLAPNRKNHIKEDAFTFFKMKEKFPIKYLWTIDLTGKIPRFGFWIQSFSFAWSVKHYIKKKKFDGVIYSRDLFSLFLLSGKKRKTFYEMHNWPNKINFIHKKIFKYSKFVVVTNNLKKELLKLGIADQDILVASGGVDIDFFDIDISQQEARKKVAMPDNKKIVLYTGHLYKWKGVYTVLPVAKQLPDIEFYFVGGLPQDIEKFNNKVKELGIKNIHTLGHKPIDMVPYYLKAADVLLLPNDGDFKEAELYTSPIKMFEYMSSNRPIIASDLPSMREVLSDKNALIVNVKSIENFKQALIKIFNNKELANSLAQQARQDVESRSWKNRANRVFNFIK